MEIRDVKEHGFDALDGHWLKSIIFCLVNFLLTVAITWTWEIPLSGGYEQWRNDGTSLNATIISILYLLIISPITYGYYIFFLYLVRNEKANLGAMFEGFYDYWRVFLTLLLQGIYTLLWTLLLIIPGVIKGLAYSQTVYILKDFPDLSPNEAISRSREMMDGYKWHYFLFLLSFIGWFILSIITLGLFLLWLTPYMNSSMAAYYEQLKEEVSPSSSSNVI